MAAEKQFENQVKDWLATVGIYRLGTEAQRMDVPPRGYYLKRWGGGKYIPEGCPDMQIVVGHFSVDVELKSKTGRLSEMQRKKLQQIRGFGGYGLVLRPHDFGDFKHMVLELLRRDEQLTETGEIWRFDLNESKL